MAYNKSAPRIKVFSMTADSEAQALHHRATLGGTLTPEELVRLEQWYAKMDQEEAAMFANAKPSTDLNRLRKQLDEALTEVVATAQKIRTQEAENVRVRGEIESLKRRPCRSSANGW
jgi:hypothetical protein